MRFSEYIKDKILICLLHLLCMILLMGFFYITGYNRNAAALILIFWWIILGIWIVTGYYRRKKYFDRAEHILENVDQRYLLGELLPASPYLEDRIYRELIRRSNKSVIERIRMLKMNRMIIGIISKAGCMRSKRRLPVSSLRVRIIKTK